MKKLYKEKRFNSFREMINNSAECFGERDAFLVRNGKEFHSIKYKELRLAFYALCTAFLSMGLKGKRIAVIGANSYAWTLCYLAAASVGVAVPLDKESSGEDVENFINAAECSLICMDDKLADKNYVNLGATKLMRFSEALALSENTSGDIDEVDAIEIKKDEMQILLFTSGTTGFAKGVCLSQNNILADIHSTVSVVKIDKEDRTMSILPLHHTYECSLDCLLILSRGACITYADSLLRVASNITEYSPSVLVVVPALLRILHNRIVTKIKEDIPEKYKALFASLSFAEAFARLPFFVRAVVRKKVKTSLGGKLRLFIVGAADLETSIVDDLTALGIRTLQGYGLTECSPLLVGNSDFYFNAKSTGIAIPGVEIMIDDPNVDGVGEILARGENIMLGYFNDEEATACALEGGWFHTGDLGRMDPDGALYITGRKKNVIVTENGKNIYPEELEARFSAFAAVEEVIIVPDNTKGKTEIKAKIYPSLERIKKELGRLPTTEEIRTLMESIVAEINKKMPDYKQIRVLEVLTEALEKTGTRKVKRYGANMA